MINRAVRFSKHHTPDPVRVVARRALLEAHNVRLRTTVPVVSRSVYDNIYHCTVRKTASQWMKALFSDPVVYRFSGLLPYDPRPYKWHFPQAVPPGRIALSLFISRKRFDALVKPQRHRAIFVLRDPRDIVVSSYFSTRNSHTPMGDVLAVRKVLHDKPVKEGMLYLVGHLAEKGTFRHLRDWATATPTEAVRLFRYEDLTGEHQRDEVHAMLRHCGIDLPPAELTALLSRYSFSRMRSDAPAAESSHYRKGRPGDWRHHFDDDIQEAFTAAAGDLVEILGYASPSRDP
jgi:hypothetical protein